MDFMTIFGLSIIIIVGIVFLVSKKIETNKNLNRDNKKTEDKIEKGEIRRNDNKDVPRKDLFNFMEFDKILDNMIIQEDNSRYTMVIQCKGVNYDLMSEIEQISVEEGFITFLNTLKYPIQLYVQATAIDLKKSMNSYKVNLDNLEDKFTTSDENYKKLSKDLSSNYEDIVKAQSEREKYANILEYADDITRYIERLGLNKHMLQRKFYIVLSYYKSEVNSTTQFSSKEIHDICHRELYTRAQTIMSGLMSCSVVGKTLNSNELAELLYVSYNRDDEKLIDIKTALDSGFYRLYSTSKDVFEKKDELMQKEIQEEAARRVKETIREAIEDGLIKLEDDLIEDFEDGSDRTAIKIINESEIDDETKDTLNEMIAQKHVIGVEKRKRQKEKKETISLIEESDEEIKIENEDVNIENGNVNIENPYKEEIKKDFSEKEENIEEIKKIEIKENELEEKQVHKLEEKLHVESSGLRDKPSEFEKKLEKQYERKYQNDSDNTNDESNLDNDSSDEDELII